MQFLYFKNALMCYFILSKHHGALKGCLGGGNLNSGRLIGIHELISRLETELSPNLLWFTPLLVFFLFYCGLLIYKINSMKSIYFTVGQLLTSIVTTLPKRI